MADLENIFEPKLLLASGRQGKVYYGVRKNTNEGIAVKIVQLSLDEQERTNQIDSLYKKINDILHLHHANLVRHIHAQFAPASTPTDVPTFTIIMEYCQGKIMHIMHIPGGLDAMNKAAHDSESQGF